MRIIITILLALTCQIGYSAEATINKRASNAILLDATDSTGDHFKWKVLSDKCKLIPIEGGKRAILVGPKGTYSIVLGVSDESGLDLIEYTVEIGGDDTPEPDDPKPDDPKPPTPYKPDFSDSKLGISQRVYDRALTVPNYINESAKLGTEIIGLAAEIASGKYANPGAIQARTKEAMKETLPESRLKDWEPVIGQSLGKELADLAKAGKLSNNREISDAYREVGIGLKALRSK